MLALSVAHARRSQLRSLRRHLATPGAAPERPAARHRPPPPASARPGDCPLPPPRSPQPAAPSVRAPAACPCVRRTRISATAVCSQTPRCRRARLRRRRFSALLSSATSVRLQAPVLAAALRVRQQPGRPPRLQPRRFRRSQAQHAANLRRSMDIGLLLDLPPDGVHARHRDQQRGRGRNGQVEAPSWRCCNIRLPSASTISAATPSSAPAPPARRPAPRTRPDTSRPSWITCGETSRHWPWRSSAAAIVPNGSCAPGVTHSPGAPLHLIRCQARCRQADHAYSALQSPPPTGRTVGLAAAAHKRYDIRRNRVQAAGAARSSGSSPPSARPAPGPDRRSDRRQSPAQLRCAEVLRRLSSALRS